MLAAAEYSSVARRPLAPVQFSTRQVPPRDRREVWSQQIFDFCGPSVTDFGPGEFDGRLEVRQASGFTCARVRHNARTTRRSMRELSRVDTGYFYLLLQAAGHTVNSQDDLQAELRPGDLTLVDSARPSAIQFGSTAANLGNEQWCLHIPRDLLESRWDGRRPRTCAPVRGAPAMVLSSLVRSTFNEHGAFNARQTDAVADALLQIVAATWAGDDPVAQQQAHEHGALDVPVLTAIQEYLRSNLASSSLSPQVIASAHNVSVRHVHRLFATSGTTLGEWLRVARLERCAADLRDRSQAGVSITEIAFRWGFNESAHFSRSFKSHYGSSPRDYRSTFFIRAGDRALS